MSRGGYTPYNSSRFRDYRFDDRRAHPYDNRGHSPTRRPIYPHDHPYPSGDNARFSNYRPPPRVAPQYYNRNDPYSYNHPPSHYGHPHHYNQQHYSNQHYNNQHYSNQHYHSSQNYPPQHYHANNYNGGGGNQHFPSRRGSPRWKDASSSSSVANPPHHHNYYNNANNSNSTDSNYNGEYEKGPHDSRKPHPPSADYPPRPPFSGKRSSPPTREAGEMDSPSETRVIAKENLKPHLKESKMHYQNPHHPQNSNSGSHYGVYHGHNDSKYANSNQYNDSSSFNSNNGTHNSNSNRAQSTQLHDSSEKVVIHPFELPEEKQFLETIHRIQQEARSLYNERTKHDFNLGLGRFNLKNNSRNCLEIDLLLQDIDTNLELLRTTNALPKPTDYDSKPTSADKSSIADSASSESSKQALNTSNANKTSQISNNGVANSTTNNVPVTASGVSS